MEELLGVGILAFRVQNYKAAVAVFSQIEQADPCLWIARLYLGLSLEKLGRLHEAHATFVMISMVCPDEFLQDSARCAISRVAPKPTPLTAPARIRVRRAKPKVYDLMVAAS